MKIQIQKLKKAALVAFAFCAINSNAQSFNPLLAQMLQDTLNTFVGFIPNIKGISASVYLPNQGMWQGVKGLSHTGVPITKEMEFGIASNSKLFTATAMLILQENGVLDLDDSLSKWLPNYPNIDPNITIRQLLGHRSGVPDFFAGSWLDTVKNNPTRVFTSTEVVSWVGPSLFPAGSSFSYSNTNYVLTDMVVKSATGFSIYKTIRDEILTPLNMDSTFFDSEEPPVGTIAHRWWDGGTGAPSADYHAVSRTSLNSSIGAAGAIFSTSSEMSQWYHALFSGQVLNPNSMAELTTFFLQQVLHNNTV